MSAIQESIEKLKSSLQIIEGKVKRIFHRNMIYVAQRYCPGHEWHAGVTSHKPVRYCSRCKRIDELTEAEFYSQFGRMPYL